MLHAPEQSSAGAVLKPARVMVQAWAIDVHARVQALPHEAKAMVQARPIDVHTMVQGLPHEAYAIVQAP